MLPNSPFGVALVLNEDKRKLEVDVAMAVGFSIATVALAPDDEIDTEQVDGGR